MDKLAHLDKLIQNGSTKKKAGADQCICYSTICIKEEGECVPVHADYLWKAF